MAGRAKGAVSGSYTPGASAKLVKTVGGSTKKIAGKRVRVGQYSVTGHPMTSRRRDFNNCSEEATACPVSTVRKNQLRSASTVVSVVDESPSSDEVSENDQNSVLSPQVREPGRGITHRRVIDRCSDYSKHIGTSHSRLNGPSGMSTARTDIAFVNKGDGRIQRGASLQRMPLLIVEYKSRDSDSRLDPDDLKMDSSRLGRAERVFSKGKPGRTRKSGLAYDEYDEEDLRKPDTITVQDNDTPTNNFRRPADNNRWSAVADGKYPAEVSPADNNRRPAESVRRPADYTLHGQPSSMEAIPPKYCQDNC